MHAVTIVDRTLQWRERPDPEPGPDEVLLRVRAAGLNGADRLQVAGFYPAPPGSAADIPGLEVAGEVAQVGSRVEGFEAGERAMAVVGGGGQAEMVVVHQRHLLRVPEGTSWEEAGGFPEAFTTAHDALFTQGQLQMGERVLVHGAAGGVGSAAVQLAVAAGATVTATVRDPARRDEVAALAGPGAPVQAIDPADFVAAGPFDVVLELVGAQNMAGNLQALAVGGRIAVIGVGAGSKAEIDLLAVMGKRARIHGSTLRSRSLEDKADAARRVERHVLPLLERGTVSVPIHSAFPMAEAAAAYEAFAAGGKLGKIVLTTGAR